MTCYETTTRRALTYANANEIQCSGFLFLSPHNYKLQMTINFQLLARTYEISCNCQLTFNFSQEPMNLLYLPTTFNFLQEPIKLQLSTHEIATAKLF